MANHLGWDKLQHQIPTSSDIPPRIMLKGGHTSVTAQTKHKSSPMRSHSTFVTRNKSGSLCGAGKLEGAQRAQLPGGLCLELCSQPGEHHVPSLTTVPEEKLPCKTCFQNSPPLQILVPCRFTSPFTSENIYMGCFQDEVLIGVLK